MKSLTGVFGLISFKNSSSVSYPNLIWGYSDDPVTVTVTVFTFSPSAFDLAVTVNVVAVSSAPIVNVPSLVILVLEDLFPDTVHVTVLSVTLSPVTVATNFCVLPGCTVALVGVTETWIFWFSL